METDADDIELEYEVQRLDKSLRIAYRVTNESDAAIWLATPLAVKDADGKDPARAYTYLDEQGTLHLTKRLWEVPDDLDVYAPEVPGCTEVPAGCEFEETLTIAMPVILDQPYQPEASGQTTLRQVRGLVFSVGYVAAQHVNGLARQTKEGEDMVVEYGTWFEGQQVLEGERVDVVVVVEEPGH